MADHNSRRHDESPPAAGERSHDDIGDVASIGGIGHDSDEGREDSDDSTDDSTDGGPRILEEARTELEQAAEDLERLTRELQERTRWVARLEALVDVLLDVTTASVVLVDPDGTVAAVSRGAVAQLPLLADGLGQQAARLLPKPVAAAVVALAEEVDADASAPSGTSPGVPEVTRLSRLPDGSVLVILAETHEE
jgi:hypothetical protein